MPVYTTTACLLTYFLAFAFRPVNYLVADKEIIIRRLVWNVHVKKTDIKAVEKVDKKEIRCSFRTFGFGGLFGYYGNFANSSLVV